MRHLPHDDKEKCDKVTLIHDEIQQFDYYRVLIQSYLVTLFRRFFRKHNLFGCQEIIYNRQFPCNLYLHKASLSYDETFLLISFEKFILLYLPHTRFYTIELKVSFLTTLKLNRFPIRFS